MELKICEFNVENLFVSMEYYSGQDLQRVSELEWREFALAQFRKSQKPLAKVFGVARAILDIDPDIVMLVEVGGEHSLENFNRYFLGDRFTPYFVEGNSRRNIDLGFLVKKDLPLRAEARSNRETPIEVTGFRGRALGRFSRDVAELRLFRDDQLSLVLLLAHLKSKISTEEDYKGKDTRTAEAIALAGIYGKLRSENPSVPMIVGGDFNADISSLELELLQRTDLADFHDLIGTATENRVSLVYFDHGERAHGLVLDYLLVSPQLRDSVVASKSGTYRYKGFYDMPEPLPRTPGERYRMPSDHYPLILTVELR